MKDINEKMTLDEAIQHCHEVAESCENKGCALNHEQLANWLEELKWFKSIASSEVDEVRLTELAEKHTAFINPEAIQIKVIGSECFKIGYRLGRKEPSDEVLDKVITLGDIFTGFYVFFAATPDKCELHDKDALRKAWNSLGEIHTSVKKGDWHNVSDIMDSAE